MAEGVRKKSSTHAKKKRADKKTPGRVRPQANKPSEEPQDVTTAVESEQTESERTPEDAEPALSTTEVSAQVERPPDNGSLLQLYMSVSSFRSKVISRLVRKMFH